MTTEQPNPAKVMDELMAYQRSACLKAAIELDLFTAVAEGATDAAALAAKCNASERGVRSLADFMTIQGFLTKSNGKYDLSPTSQAFLVRHSPAYIGSMARFLGAGDFVANLNNLTDIVRRGGVPDQGTVAPENDLWVEFAKGMAPLMAMVAGVMVEHLGTLPDSAKVLDIAAGHGQFGLAVAKKYPTSRLAGLDWGKVLEVAKENAAKAGVSNRYSTIPADAFTVDFGKDYDLILVPNFLHHFDMPTIVEFLRKVKAALKAGGRVAVVEFVPNEDRVSPPMPASFTMTMLSGTPSGDAYTFNELQKMLTEAGFSQVARIDLLPTPQTLLVASA